jgi:hypothetical protein
MKPTFVIEMAIISFDRPMIIKDDKAAAALIEAATCSPEPIKEIDILGKLERGRRLVRKIYSH